MTEHRVAAGVADTELASYQRAVRVLLTHAIVTAQHPDAESLDRVRRWAPKLQVDLADLAGYRLEITQTVIRLVRHLDRLDRTQPLTSNGRPFDRRRYAYLCLCLAALGRAGAQIALTELAGAVRSSAADVAGLGFDPDKYAQRIAFVDAVLYLERIGAVLAADGSTASWQKDPEAGEALFDIDRDICHLLFLPSRIVQHVRSVGDFMETALPLGRDARRAATRQRLARLLLEYPVVYYDDLTEADRRYLQNEARELAADLARLTGGQLERRGEGVALIDTAASFSDMRFPGTGTPAHVALLIAERITEARSSRDSMRPEVRRPASRDGHDVCREDLDRALPTAGRLEVFSPAHKLEDGEEASVDIHVPLIGDDQIAAWVDAIVAQHRAAIAKDYRSDPVLLADEAIGLLEKFELVRRVPGGCVALPAIARYRVVVTTVVEPNLGAEAG
jgi:uncharacterized protein (TIGR02678 family)